MITRKNYYEILGVTPDSEEAEIKAAYRKLARKYHPDVNKNNSESSKMFIDVSEAYDVLIHVEKRKQYDTLNGFFKSGKTKTDNKRTGFQDNPSEKASRTDNDKQKDKKSNYKQEQPETHFSDTINKMFDEFTRNNIKSKKEKDKDPPKKGDDIYTDISITLEESVNGASRTVNIMNTRQCPSCAGRKFINGSSCSECLGKGEILQHKKITVKIPKNVKNGSKLRVADEGNNGLNGGKNGDLYINIKIEGCSKIKYDGSNILYSVPISPVEAVLGGDIHIPTFEGNVAIKVPPHTNSGQKFRLSGLGLNQSGKIGDMIVTVHIEIPASLSEDEIRLYEKLKKLSTTNLRENLLNE